MIPNNTATEEYWESDTRNMKKDYRVKKPCFQILAYADKHKNEMIIAANQGKPSIFSLL